jgi:AbrB family looped-hinge helix DNA binding protein
VTVTLSNKGRIVLPDAVREQMHLEPGQNFEVFIDDEDTVILRRINRPPNHGLVDHLLSCPYPLEIMPRAKDSDRSNLL